MGKYPIIITIVGSRFVMYDLLLLLYCMNSVLLILHEMDSAYWKEWELFKIPGGIEGFLVVHIPILLILFYGLLAIDNLNPIGIVISLGLSLAGLFAFGIHTYFLMIQKREEFNSRISISILLGILFVSIIELIYSFFMLSVAQFG